MSLHAQTTEVHGFVQDARGKPVASAAITLRCDPAAGSVFSLTTSSDLQGTYAFKDVRRLLCRIEASASGLTVSTQLDLTHAQAAQLNAPDLVLAPASTEQVTPTSALPPISAPPTFQAAGIRGLIDPGGYSAPAGAAAASSLLSSMADVRRTGSGAAAGAPPCAAASGLLQAVQEHPKSVEANRKLADFYLTHGQITLALPYLRSAHQASPSDRSALLDLAQAQIAQESFAEAHLTLAELPSTSGDSRVHVLMAEAAEGLGSFDEAAAQYRLAQEHDRSIDNIFGQGYELILASRLSAADSIFQDGLTYFPHSAKLMIGKGVAEYLGGLGSASVSTFLSAIAINPSDPQPYPFLAQAYLISGEHAPEVITALRTHLARSSGDGTAYYQLALALSRPDASNPSVNDAEVAALLRKANALDPQLVLAHFRLGVLLSRQSNDEAAAAEFEQVLRLQATLSEAHFRLAGLYRKLGRNDAAAREMSLFRNARPTGETKDESSGADLRQFISVLHRTDSVPLAAACNE